MDTHVLEVWTPHRVMEQNLMEGHLAHILTIFPVLEKLTHMCKLITVHPIHIFMAIIASPLQSKWRTQFSKYMEQKIDEAIEARNIQFSADHEIYFFARETLFLWPVSSYPQHFGIL